MKLIDFGEVDSSAESTRRGFWIVTNTNSSCRINYFEIEFSYLEHYQQEKS